MRDALHSFAALFGDKLGGMFAAGVVWILGGLVLAVANRRAPEAVVLGGSERPKSRFG